MISGRIILLCIFLLFQNASTSMAVSCDFFGCLQPGSSDCKILVKEIAPSLNWNVMKDSITIKNCCSSFEDSDAPIIECDEKNHIVRLDLHEKGLNGHLPSSISKLTRLESLILHSNALSGPIPSQISLLKRLNYLSLQDNHFNGPMPFALASKKWFLSHFTYDKKNEEESDDCVICLEKMQASRANVIAGYFECGSGEPHKFHDTCLKEWVKKTGVAASCPICRAHPHPHNIKKF